MNKRIFESYHLLSYNVVQYGMYKDFKDVQQTVFDCLYITNSSYARPIRVQMTVFTSRTDDASLDPMKDAVEKIPTDFTAFTDGTNQLYIIESINPIRVTVPYRVVKVVPTKDSYPVQDEGVTKKLDLAC